MIPDDWDPAKEPYKSVRATYAFTLVNGQVFSESPGMRVCADSRDTPAINRVRSMFTEMIEARMYQHTPNGENTGHIRDYHTLHFGSNEGGERQKVLLAVFHIMAITVTVQLSDLGRTDHDYKLMMETKLREETNTAFVDIAEETGLPFFEGE
jgi:hypothetical protein